jgi:hypothetical protein
MKDEELAAILQRIIGMVSSVEQATAASLEVLIEDGIINRDVLLRGLAKKRQELDPKYSTGMFDALIERLSTNRSGEIH